MRRLVVKTFQMSIKMFRRKLNSKEAKEFLGIKSDDTLRRFENEEGLKTNRYPGSPRKYFYEIDLENFLRKNERK